MLFFYLLLGHLVSDYLLQPDSLVAWKNKSKWGVAVHATVHFLVTTLLLYLFAGTYLVMLLALAISTVHFIIDSFKAAHDQKSGYTMKAYWTDQLAHYLTITAVSLASKNFPIFMGRPVVSGDFFDAVFLNPVFVSFCCLAIFSTLTIEYGYYRKGLQKKHGKKSTLNKSKMIKRLFLVTLVYIGLLFSSIPGVGLYFGS